MSAFGLKVQRHELIEVGFARNSIAREKRVIFRVKQYGGYTYSLKILSRTASGVVVVNIFKTVQGRGYAVVKPPKTAE